MTVDNPQHVIFIDSRVPDIQDLLDGVKPGELVFVLDPGKDGVQQIADILAANNLGNLSTISIVSHGAVGEVTLGATMLTEANLAAHAAALAEIGAALGAGGTLQLFGCDVGLGAAGQQFVNDFAMFAGGINVAAATHDIGSAALGGSWTLDVTAAPGIGAAGSGPALNSDGLPVTPAGSPQAASAGASPASNIPFTQQALNEFSGVLANPVQTELWITASGGGQNTELIHVDDNGGASSINNTTLWSPTSANRPTQVTQVTDVAIDPTNQFYFISQANTGSGSNVIYKGSIAQELSNPSGTPTLTAIFTQTGPLGGPSGTGFITQLALDPDNQQIYWAERHSIVKANYDGSAVTTLATGGSNVFADGLALDLPHNQAFFFSTTTFTTFATTTSGSTIVTAVDSNAIYVDSNLSAASVVTPTKLTMSPADSVLGNNNFPVSLGLITGIAVDTVTEKLYFTTQPVSDPTKFSGTGTGGIYEYDLTGNPSHTYHAVWVEPSSSSLFLTYIHIDNATNSYYVTDVNPTGGGIYKGDLSSTLAPTLFTSIVASTVSMSAQGFDFDNAPSLVISPSNNAFTESVSNPASANNTPVSVLASATVTDTDDTKALGATVSVGGFFTGDVLGATTTGTSITSSYNSTTGVLTLTGVDTLAHYQSVLASVTFTSTSENPTDYGSDTSRTLTFSINDGLLASAPQTATVTVVGVDDAPTLAGTANASFTENGPAVTLSPSVTVTDPDSLNLASATVALTGGTFAGDGDVLAASTAGTSITASYNAATETLTLTGSDTFAHYQQVLDSVTFVTASENPDNGGAAPTRTVTWTLNDGGAASSVTTTVSITAVNDAPTLSGTTNASFTENGSPVTLSGAASVSDPDNVNLAGATVAITGGTFAGDGDVLAASTAGTSITASYNAATETLVLSGSDTLAHYQQVLDSVTFVTASENPDNGGAAPTRTVTWTLDDGSASNATTSVTTTVSITAVNDAPTLSGTANASFTENGPAVTLSGAASVSDPDSASLVGATVAITGGTFAGDGDVLAANTAGTSITASYNAATETLVLSGSDTLAHYQQVLDSVTFVTASDNPDNGGAAPTRTVTWTLDDGSASNATTSVTTTVSITAVNDAPAVSAAASASYTEQAAATTLSGGLAVADPDSPTLTGATVKITGGTFAGDGDVLGFSTAGTSISASYNSTTETLVLSGVDTVAHYQSVLDSVTFFDAGDNPTNYGSNTTRVVTWVVTDGSASNGTSNVATTTLNVTAVNDAPTLGGVPSTAQYSSGDTLTVAPAASVADPDNLTLANATVQVTSGGFAGDGDVLAANVSGTSISASYNAATETLVLSGSDTLAHYQQVLDSVTFTAGSNPTNFGSNPTRTLSWVVNDGSGSNNTATATTTISITGSAVKNDFNGDHKSDILFQASVGPLHDGLLIDFMNGTTVASQASLPGAGLTWSVVGSGDFNSDGKADILWQNIDGTPLIWTMDGSTVTSTTTLSNPGITWDAVGTGDFNGDGKADIVFQNSNGTPMIWTMNGTSVASTATLSNPGATWKLIGTGDFNGDGKSDLVFQKPNGTPMIWEMNGTSVIASATLPKPSGGGSWKLIGTGDFNGDGDADLLFQKSNGTPMIWTMNGTSVVSTATLANPGASWHAIGTGDYNGDNKADILFQNSNGTPLIWTMNGTSVTATATLPNPGSIWHANTG